MGRSASGNSVALPSSAARGWAALQLSTPSDSGPKIAYMSAKFRHSTSLAGLVSTEMPSKATLSSMNSIPASSHAATSSSSIGRDASEMSVSPAQNSSKPSPVPGPSTVAAMLEQSSSFSPTAVEMGSTVDEPETTTSPSTSAGQSPPSVLLPSSVVSSEEVSSSSPHAAATRPKASSRASQANRFFLSKGCPPWGATGVLQVTGRRGRP